MSWLRIDDGFVEHPKVYDLSDRAFRLHVAALCYSARNLTDGMLDAKRIAVLCAITKAKPRHICELIDAELWTESDENGYTIRDYLDYNPSAETVKKRRAEAKERMAALRSLQERSHEHSHERTGERSHTPDPGPTQTSTSKDQNPSRMDSFSALSGKPEKPHTLGAGRDAAFALLLTRIAGGDDGTAKVLWGFCKKLPQERIEDVAARFSRRRVHPGVAVKALKESIGEYDRELRAEVVA